METKKENETIPVATRITKPMLREIQAFLAANAHINLADYIRDVIRRDLEDRSVKTEEASE